MADGSSTPEPTEVSVADVAAHAAAVVAAGQALVALINSKPALYPIGLPSVMADLAAQTSFRVARIQAAMPATSGS